jgi:hypothetical protein
VERAMGIEPTAQAWEAWVLPLYDARMRLILFSNCVYRNPTHCHYPVSIAAPIISHPPAFAVLDSP